jgi:hypothetical protein
MGVKGGGGIQLVMILHMIKRDLVQCQKRPSIVQDTASDDLAHNFS